VETLFHNFNERGKGTNPSGNERKNQNSYHCSSCSLSYYYGPDHNAKRDLYSALKNSKRYHLHYHINYFFNHNPQLTISQEARSRNKSSAEIENWHYIDRGFSIRFVSDYSGNFEDIRSFEKFTNPELINVDGILVKKRELGELKNLWINDNLKPEIPIVSTPEDWKKSGIEGKPASCYYQFKPSNRHMGLYYNWYALSAISFERSRIPTKTDWLELSAVSSNVVTTSNSTSIFNGLLGGYCDDNGVFFNNEIHGYWWLNPDTNNEVQWLTNSGDSTGEVLSDPKKKGFGFFIRYIRLQ